MPVKPCLELLRQTLIFSSVSSLFVFCADDVFSVFFICFFLSESVLSYSFHMISVRLSSVDGIVSPLTCSLNL